MHDGKPFRDHRDSPAISIYILNDNSDAMEPFNCWYCRRTITDIKAVVDHIITTPQPLAEFGLAFNIRCKLCHQNYRMLANAQAVQG